MNGYGRTNSPCYQCDRRQSGCHATCEQYIDFQDIHDKEVKQIRKNKDEYNKCRTGYMSDKEFKQALRSHNKNRVFKQTMR